MKVRELRVIVAEPVQCGRCGRSPILSTMIGLGHIERPHSVACVCGRVIPRWGASSISEAIETWNSRTTLIAAANKRIAHDSTGDSNV